MTAIERFQTMLDELGVEWNIVKTSTGIEHIVWHPNEGSCLDWHEEFGVGWLAGWQKGVTPERAIDATLADHRYDDKVIEMLNATNDGLISENAKLLELVRDMWHVMDDRYAADAMADACYKVLGCEVKDVERRVRDLGVEA